MDTQTLDAPLIPTGEEFFAELRGEAPAKPADSELVTVKLSLDQASYLWVKLRRLTVDDDWRPSPETLQKELVTIPSRLFEYLWEKIEDLRATTPVIASGRGSVQFLKRTLTLRLRRHQAKYLLQILKNKRHDKWRRENLERGLFAPLQVVEIAEDGDEEEPGRAPLYRPARGDNPDAKFHRVMLKKALKELPRKLKMPAEDVKALLRAIVNADGNVSQAAEIVGQPQRKTARRIQRILAHLKRRGFSA